MKVQAHRKLTRFYIINPVNDRRFEQRFESTENVLIRFERTGRSYPAVAYDISRRGARLESEAKLESGADVHIAFPKAPDHIRCFGRFVWARPFEEGNEYEGGVTIDGWYGIIEGAEFWKRYR